MSLRRRVSEDEPFPPFLRWVRLHEDPATRYTYVYLRGADVSVRPPLKLDLMASENPRAELYAAIKDFLIGVICLTCGKELVDGSTVCKKCKGSAIKDLRGLIGG